MMPTGPEEEVGDPKYLRVVSRGLEAVPELAALLDDSSKTPEAVPLFGGVYAIADIAHVALSDIISGIPWINFIPGDTQDMFTTCGYCVYWDYARRSVENRRHLKDSFLAWYSLHASELIWEANPELLTKGHYACRTSNPGNK